MRKWPMFYMAYVILVLLVWTYYITTNDHWHLFSFDKIKEVMITMIFGAFVAGSSPEGSAAIAYPIFTLWLDISPQITKNFAFAIQSFGMTAASIYILNCKMRIDKTYIYLVSIAGAIGLIFGTYFIADHIPAQIAKLFFVSLWVSLGIILYRIYNNHQHHLIMSLPKLTTKDFWILGFFGIVGGIISSIFGTGINILTFCVMVVYYHLDIKVATRSSIIIMTVETLLGFFIHSKLIQDFSVESKTMWLACIPIVIFAAPLGTFISAYLSERKLSNFISTIFVIQFIGALFVIKPSGTLLLLPAFTILISYYLFKTLNEWGAKVKLNA